MRNITILFFLIVFLAGGKLLAQDPSSENKKEQNQNKNMAQTEFQIQYGAQFNHRFQDKNGDGINDNGADHDGDGIPNGRDDDYTGNKARNGNVNAGFVDEDGDGLNDNAVDDDGDGIPNGHDEDWEPPLDGTGYKHKNGAGATATKFQRSAMGTAKYNGNGPKARIRK